MFTIFIRERTVKALLNEENVEIFCTFTTLSLRFPASKEEEEEEEEEKEEVPHRATSVAALFRVNALLLVRPL